MENERGIRGGHDRDRYSVEWSSFSQPQKQQGDRDRRNDCVDQKNEPKILWTTAIEQAGEEEGVCGLLDRGSSRSLQNRIVKFRCFQGNFIEEPVPILIVN